MSVAVPTSLADAVALLHQDPQSTIIAGGTDLMVQINAGRRRPSALVSLRRVPELRGWSVEGERMRVGAACTYRELEHPDVAALAPALAQAARTVGSPQIRNAGTIGGNLATASPAGDTLPVLVALDAELEIVNDSGTRSVAIRDFLLGPKRTALEPSDIIAAVSFRLLRGPQEYLKVGTRNAMVISVASVALLADLDAPERPTARLALGTVGPTVLRATTAEAWMRDHVDFAAKSMSGDLADFVGAVREDAQPIDDHRSTAAYRRHAVGVCARRALERVLA